MILSLFMYLSFDNTFDLKLSTISFVLGHQKQSQIVSTSFMKTDCQTIIKSNVHICPRKFVNGI